MTKFSIWDKFIEAERCIYLSVNLANFGSDTGLLPVWIKAIILTNADSYSIDHKDHNTVKY